MKNILLIGLSMLFSQTLLLAYDAEINGIYYNFSGTDATVTNASTDDSYCGDVVIHESVIYNDVTYNVTSIGSSAFSGCTGLTSIVIPNSVTSIGYDAFSGCTGLTSFEIPNSVTSIGRSVFSGCSSLESISLPFVGDVPHTSSDKYQYPFGYIFGTSSYTGGEGTSQFYYGRSTSSTTSDTYYIPSSLKTVKITGSSYIPYGAFSSCSGLTNIEIPNSVTSIEGRAFSGCWRLTSIKLPNSIKSIGEAAFQNCTGLTNIEIADGVTSMGDFVFYGCESLKCIKIPYGVKSLSTQTFDGCTSLKIIEIPNSVTSMSDGIFSYCPSLESLTLPYVGKVDQGYTLATFGSLFSKTRRLESDIEISQHYSNGLRRYYLPASLKTVKVTGELAKYAFYDCKSLKKIILGNGVKENGQNAFQYCSVTNLVIEDGEEPLTLSSLPSTDTLYLGRNLGTNLPYCKNVTIGDGVTSIVRKGFYNSLRSEGSNVIMGKNVAEIGDSAFYGCKGKLTINSDLDNFLSSEEGGFSGAKFSEIVIGDNVTKIGKFAFADLVDLRKITLGKSVNRVLTKAFAGCIHLTELYCQPTTPPACVTTVFDEDTYLDCTLYVPEESLEQYQTANIWKNFYDFDVNPDVTPVHKLIYRIDGNIYRTEMVEEGATIVAIEAPVREGYTFVGWSGMPADMIMPDHDLTVVGTYAAPVSETALTIVDGDALDFSLSHTYENLSYTRTFSNTNWQALYVPFSIPVDSLSKNGLQVAELNDTHQWDFNGDGVADSTRVEFFTLTSGNTEANNPYLIRATEPTTLSLTLKDIEVKAAEENSIECSSTKQKFTFVGTYTGVSGADMYDNNYYGISGGGLKRVSSTSVSLKPQRWYMKIENKNGSPVNYFAPSIRFTVDGIDEEEEETSAIVDMCTESRNRHKAFYSLEGIRQHTAPTQSGMYVRQDKKLIIR